MDTMEGESRPVIDGNQLIVSGLMFLWVSTRAVRTAKCRSQGQGQAPG